MRNHFFLAAALALMAIIALGMAGQEVGLGPVIMLFFVLLALGLGRSEQWRRLAFTAWIVAAVAASLFYPAPFRELWGFDLKKLIIPLLMIIMFGMGTAMSVRDFLGVVRMPKGVFVGLLCQFTIMPAVGFGLTKVFAFPPEIAAGLILVGCSPSGLASNVMSFIARANLALSLTLTAIATLLAPIFTPLLMSLLAGQLVPVNAWAMMLDILRIVILPVVAGLAFNHFFYERFPWLARTMPRVSMVGIAVIIAIITAAGRDSLLTIGLTLILATAVHNAAGYFFGYWGSRLFGLDRQSCRTIALEVGLQNSGLASGLALEMGKVATMGLAPAVFGPLMNVTGSSLASWWRGKVGDS
ncbi:MAG: bile acid:sodium symporter family protein [Phaeodactylibacter sp.]|nr:bile acid:sodium symporter family protein [Phaeodactylibacter sp.]MCB9052341.1 bile acid:sodium symporter family protein [Lewinellaceae bacterium]